MVLLNGCTGELFDEPLEKPWDNNELMEAEISYNKVIQSSDFEQYNSYCVNFISIVRELTNRMSKEEQEELVELTSLYRSDPQRYESLYKYQVDKILLKKDSIRVREAYSLLLDARKKIIGNQALKSDIEKSTDLISTRLSENWINLKESSLVKLKTRTESGNQACLDACKEDYNASMRHAYTIMSCGTVLNIGACVFSLGLSVPAAAWTQAGIFAFYQIEVNKIEGDYERCKRRCG